MTELENKRQQRKKNTAECFTPPKLVSEMLDKLPFEVFIDPTKTFCDPAAGNGNFLVEILHRKILQGHGDLQSLSTIYGVELMADNVKEMKKRLLYTLLSPTPEAYIIMNHNIVCADALKFDFESL